MEGGGVWDERDIGQRLGELFEPQQRDDRGAWDGLEAPLTGANFQQFQERMRDLEEMLTTPELRAEAAAIRDRARQERIEMQRHSRDPNWELVRTSVYEPMVELQKMVTEERARRSPEKSLVPIDRDPVPDRYAELVRQYYEQLSKQPQGTGPVLPLPATNP